MAENTRNRSELAHYPVYVYSYGDLVLFLICSEVMKGTSTINLLGFFVDNRQITLPLAHACGVISQIVTLAINITCMFVIISVKLH